MNRRQRIAALYSRVFALLDEASLSDEQLLSSAKKSGRYMGVRTISSDVEPVVKEIYQELASAFGDNDRLTSFLSHDTPESAEELTLNFTSFAGPWTFSDWEAERERVLHQLPIVSSMYSGLTVCTTYQMMEHYGAGGEEGVARFPYVYLELLKAMRPLLERGLAVVVPSSIAQKYVNETFERTNLHDTVLKSCDFEAPILSSPFRTIGDYVPPTTPCFGVGFPTIDGLPLGDLINLRDEYALEFDSYQRALKRFLRDIPSSKTENAVRDAYQEVVEQCNALTHRYQESIKKRRAKGLRVLGGSVATLLSITTPAPVSGLLSAFVGGSTVFDGFTYLRERKDVHALIKASEYWWPWKALGQAT